MNIPSWGDWSHRPKGRDAQGGRRTWRKQHEVNPTPEPPFGALIKSITAADLDVASCDGNEAVISDSELAASFNWINSQEPTILVPGSPPRWTPLARPVRLGQDMGAYFRDVNAAHFPQHPIEAAVLAALSRGDNLADTDIVACSSMISSLLRFVRGNALDPREHKPFRMVAERSEGGTVFLVRRENSPRELIPNVRGFGHTFPEAYTTWDSDVKKSVSHQRLVRYRFGGLGFLIRSEADGYIPEKSDEADEDGCARQAMGPAILAEILAEARITSSDSALSADGRQLGEPKEAGVQPALRVHIGGTLQPQDTVFELKTRSIRVKHKDDMFAKELPRLWVAQIPTLILAYHEDGLFEDVQVHDVRDKIQEWETAQKNVLKKLAALIQLILSELDKTPSRRLEICYKDTVDRLDLRQPGPGVTDALSKKTQSLWEDRNQAVRSGPDSPSPEEDEKDEEEEEEDEDCEEGVDLSWNDAEEDFTACSSACEYCGRCTY